MSHPKDHHSDKNKKATDMFKTDLDDTLQAFLKASKPPQKSQEETIAWTQPLPAPIEPETDFLLKIQPIQAEVIELGHRLLAAFMGNDESLTIGDFGLLLSDEGLLGTLKDDLQLYQQALSTAYGMKLRKQHSMYAALFNSLKTILYHQEQLRKSPSLDELLRWKKSFETLYHQMQECNKLHEKGNTLPEPEITPMPDKRNLHFLARAFKYMQNEGLGNFEQQFSSRHTPTKGSKGEAHKEAKNTPNKNKGGPLL